MLRLKTPATGISVFLRLLKEITPPRAKHAKRLAALCACWLLAALPCAAMPIVNGDFSAGLSGWTSQGDVTAGTNATLGDAGAIYSLLYQGVGAAPGNYRLQFDFRNQLADAPSGFPDSFFASLYFSDNLAAFDLGATPPMFDDLIPLMDLDPSGASNVAGALSASGLGAGWTHFSFDFTNGFGFVIPVFEFLDFDGIDSNSQASLGNVELDPLNPVVPEPATIALIGAGAACLAALRRRKSPLIRAAQ